MWDHTPLYVFDLDGTLALIDHRRHFHDAGDHDSFYAACDKDLPNVPVIRTMEGLRVAGAEVWVFSGRRSEVREKTVAWLARYTSFTARELETALVMRPAGDRTPDDELKQRFFDSMWQVDRDRLVAVFDDRQRVVDMWRSNGVTCFQVAPGQF